MHPVLPVFILLMNGARLVASRWDLIEEARPFTELNDEYASFRSIMRQEWEQADVIDEKSAIQVASMSLSKENIVAENALWLAFGDYFIDDTGPQILKEISASKAAHSESHILHVISASPTKSTNFDINSGVNMHSGPVAETLNNLFGGHGKMTHHKHHSVAFIHIREKSEAVLAEIFKVLKQLNLLIAGSVLVMENMFNPCGEMANRGLFALYYIIPFDLKLIGKSKSKRSRRDLCPFYDGPTNSSSSDGGESGVTPTLPLQLLPSEAAAASSTVLKMVTHVPPKHHKTVALITAIVGTYEASLKQAVRQIGENISTTFICFAQDDKERLYSPYWIIDRTPYHILYRSPLDTGEYLNSFDANGTTFPFNKAKYYKQQWHLIPRLRHFDFVVWLDGTVEIMSNTFTADIVSHLHHEDEEGTQYYNYSPHRGLDKSHSALSLPVTAPTPAPAPGVDVVTLYLHWRKNLFDEVEASLKGAKFKYGGENPEIFGPKQLVLEQYQSFLARGYEDVHNVSVTCIVAVRNNERSHMFNNDWFLENLEWSTQDQVSFPFVAWLHNFTYYIYDEPRAYNRLEHGLRRH